MFVWFNYNTQSKSIIHVIFTLSGNAQYLQIQHNQMQHMELHSHKSFPVN